MDSYNESIYIKLKNNVRLPKSFYKNEDNLISFVRYIMVNKLNITSKDDIGDSTKLNINNFRNYKIENIIKKLGGKIKACQVCFPQFKLVAEDFNKYSDRNINKIIFNFIKLNNIKVEDILEGGISKYIRSNKNESCNTMKNLLAYLHEKSISQHDMFINYFKINRIKHPKFNRNIDIYDFKYHNNDFYKNKNNRIAKIKRYCEEICGESILNNMNNKSIRCWIKKYFNQVDVNKYVFDYQKLYDSLYSVLIEAYPQIKHEKLLFEWEWTQYSKNDKETLIKILREFVKYRMNDYIKDEVNDIPKYINRSTLEKIEPKLVKHIQRKRFDSFYDWCCEAFPEYKDKWKKEYFSNFIAFDGVELDSIKEKLIYEHIKKNINPYIEAIGRERNGTKVFKVDFKGHKRFCPDFLIQYIDIDNVQIKIKKPIVIEYFGMYTNRFNTSVTKAYRLKTHIKNEYYKSNEDIIFLDLYPEDLENDLYGLNKKINHILNNIKFQN